MGCRVEEGISLLISRRTSESFPGFDCHTLVTPSLTESVLALPSVEGEIIF